MSEFTAGAATRRSRSARRGPRARLGACDRARFGALPGQGVVTTSTYTVIYERDERGWWVTSVRGVRGGHTQGRTLEQARQRVREALGLFVKNANTADFVEQVRLPQQARRALARGVTARQRADQERAKAAKALQEAVRVLARMGLSRRDTGELLGLSHQRVQQVVGA